MMYEHRILCLPRTWTCQGWLATLGPVHVAAVEDLSGDKMEQNSLCMKAIGGYLVSKFLPQTHPGTLWTEDQWDADHCRRDRGGMSECQGRKSNKSRGIQGRNKKPGLAHQERANMDRGLKPQLHRNSVHNTTYCCPKIRFLRQRLLEFSLNFGGNLSICCRIMTPRFSPAPWSLSCKKVFTLGPVLACEMFRAKTSQNHVHGIGSKNVVCFPSKANVWQGDHSWQLTMILGSGAQPQTSESWCSSIQSTWIRKS
jgi:hypothetical protein